MGAGGSECLIVSSFREVVGVERKHIHLISKRTICRLKMGGPESRQVAREKNVTPLEPKEPHLARLESAELKKEIADYRGEEGEGEKVLLCESNAAARGCQKP